MHDVNHWNEPLIEINRLKRGSDNFLRNDNRMSSVLWVRSHSENNYGIKNAARRIDRELAGENVTSCSETPIEFANEVAKRIKRWGCTSGI